MVCHIFSTPSHFNEIQHFIFREILIKILLLTWQEQVPNCCCSSVHHQNVRFVLWPIEGQSMGAVQKLFEDDIRIFITRWNVLNWRHHIFWLGNLLRKWPLERMGFVSKKSWKPCKNVAPTCIVKSSRWQSEGFTEQYRSNPSNSRIRDPKKSCDATCPFFWCLRNRLGSTEGFRAVWKWKLALAWKI